MIIGQVCDHTVVFVLFELLLRSRLCWENVAIMSKWWNICAWQRQAVDLGIYGGNAEVSFCGGVCSPFCRSSYTCVSNGKLCPDWWRPPFLFFSFLKGTNQEPGFQSRFVFCYSNRRITRLHSICCWTASVRAPSVNVLFLLCVKTLIKYKYTAECTVCCKCQGIFQVFYTCCVHKISTKLKVMWIKSVPLAEHSGETWDLIWWDWF